MDEDQQKQSKPRIGYVMAALILLFTLCGDLLQFLVTFFHVIPAVGNALAIILAWFIAIFVSAALWIWFLLLDTYKSGKKVLAKVLAGFVALGLEAVPILDALPGFTGGAIITIVMTWHEDGQLGQVIDLASNLIPMGKGAKVALTAASKFTGKS